ncbi:MAG: PEP-CTERM sorting domain-containing protein [Pirellulales bacterium]|nr:PEP-CTERM sorting domain-containing protein [Pirellulales bacterium]
MYLRLTALLVLLSGIALSPVNAWAGIVLLHGIADGDSTYYEYNSDAFFRMDLPDPGTSQQRFHAISDPSVTFGNPAFDGFPHDEFFRMGSVTYNDADLVGGSGVATITALNLGVTVDPLDPSYMNYARWTIDTLVHSFNGTVTVVDGVPTAMDLVSDINLRINLGTVTIDNLGTFNVSGNRFYVDASGNPTTGDEPFDQFVFDFQGTLTTVPEPSTYLVAMLGTVGVGLIGWRRRGRRLPISNS